MIDTSHLNIFDGVVLGIMGLSCLFAFFRGLVREILSLVAWVGAGIVTVYYFHSVAEKLQDHFKNPNVAVAVSIVGLYIAALIGFGIINMLIVRTIKSGGDAGMLDNLLGLGFGALRGALIVSLGYALLVFALAGKEHPNWMKDAVTRPYVERGADMLAKAAPDFIHEVTSLEKTATDNLQSRDSAPTAAEQKDTGYSRTSTQQLDRLIDSTSNNR